MCQAVNLESPNTVVLNAVRCRKRAQWAHKSENAITQSAKWHKRANKDFCRAIFWAKFAFGWGGAVGAKFLVAQQIGKNSGKNFMTRSCRGTPANKRAKKSSSPKNSRDMGPKGALLSSCNFETHEMDGGHFCISPKLANKCQQGLKQFAV